MRALTTSLAIFVPIKLPYSWGMVQHLFKIFIIRDIYHKKIESIIFLTIKLPLLIIIIFKTKRAQRRCRAF
ncbi:hypothetical protein BN871_GP_00040 [Paenibacillus sp. P22]|nr:hypothetical protein BN871_GP_00040 [Paenibacillus sp. P22]